MAQKIEDLFPEVSMFRFMCLFFTLSVLTAPPLQAEVLECKGSASTNPPTKIEISVDMDKKKSSLRWIYPDGSGITQGQSISRRKFDIDGTNVKYMDEGSDRVFLQVPVSSAGVTKGTFTHAPQGLNGVPVDCEIFGSIPPAPRCPKNKDRALLAAMDTADSIDTIDFLLQCGANANATNTKGCTPLMLAIDPDCHPGNASGMINDTAALVDLFLSNGAFVDTRDKKGETALIKAARNSTTNVYTSFIASEADFMRSLRKLSAAVLALICLQFLMSAAAFYIRR